MNSSNPTICVVIPYYQVASEPLARAIRSILAQQGVERPMVLIVDDSSPLPAGPIIAEHFPDHKDYIRIIVQKNGGAANARNTGLGNLPEDTTYVAFLDSDDEWTKDHLSNALKLLDYGCDFYFADHKRTEWNESKFALTGFALDRHKCLDKASALYEYKGDILFPVMNDHLIQTSTIVYKKDSMADIRFPEDLVLGEDEVFWIRAMRRARKSCFCNRIEVLMGKGVNISQGGEWGDERSFKLTAQNMLYWRQVAVLLPDEKELKALRRLKTSQLRRNLAASVWYRLRRGMGLPMRHILEATSADPAWIFSLWIPIFMHIRGKRHE